MVHPKRVPTYWCCGQIFPPARAKGRKASNRRFKRREGDTVILDLDKLREAGEIPRDLDARIQRILGLSETCEGPLVENDPDYTDFGCSVCGEDWVSTSSNDYPELRKVHVQTKTSAYPATKWFKEHQRVPRPYSSNLEASGEVLKWLESLPEVVRIGREYGAESSYGSALRRIKIGKLGGGIAVTFSAFSDEPLAIALAVDRLFGEQP